MRIEGNPQSVDATASPLAKGALEKTGSKGRQPFKKEKSPSWEGVGGGKNLLDIPLLKGKNKFLIAYSGGVDSTALLWLMVHAFGPANCVAVYFDHGLRSQAERNTDKRTVQALANHLDVRIVCRSLPVQTYATRYKCGIEEAGRYLRYAMLRHLSRLFRCDAVVTAHHQDDSVESLLMQLASGALLGVQGIRPFLSWEGCEIYHPLWRSSKLQLQAFADAQALPYSEDLTNTAPYLRNRVRHEIAAPAKRVFPSFAEKISGFGNWMSEVEAYIASRIPDKWKNLPTPLTSVAVSKKEFAVLPPLEQQWLARHWLMLSRKTGGTGYVSVPKTRFSTVHVHAVIAVAMGIKQRYSLPGKQYIWRKGDRVFFGE